MPSKKAPEPIVVDDSDDEVAEIASLQEALKSLLLSPCGPAIQIEDDDLAGQKDALMDPYGGNPAPVVKTEVKHEVKSEVKAEAVLPQPLVGDNSNSSSRVKVEDKTRQPDCALSLEDIDAQIAKIQCL